MDPTAKISEKARAPLSDDAALVRVAAGVEAEIGERFFSSLARGLALALDVQYAFVTRLCDDGTHFRTLGLWERDHFGENVELPLTGTPCELVLRGQAAHHPAELCARFPDDQLLADWRAQSYCGVPVLDAQGRVFGHVAIVDDKPMPDGPRGLAVMRIFAERVRAEIERLRTEDALRSANHRLAQSEESFRDLFEEAPIAYLYEGIDSRWIRANRAAMRILGVKPEEAAGLFGESLVAGTSDTRSRLREALESAARGIEARGVVLELRRKDDGRPVWIEWWAKPVAGGQYLRTMFIDVTDRMLMEQEKTRLEAHNAYLLDEIRS